MKSEFVFRGSVLSEKAVGMQESSKVYSLKVNPTANKADIKKALKELFNVDAVAVNTLITARRTSRKARSKKGGAVMVRSAPGKKAFIRLAPGQSLPTPADALGTETEQNRGPAAQ